MVKIRIELEIEKCTQCPEYRCVSCNWGTTGVCRSTRPLKEEVAEGLPHRSVMEGRMRVVGVPEWCPHLVKD